MGRKSKWIMGSAAAVAATGGLFASYNDVRGDLLAQNKPLMGEIHKSTVCQVNATAREYTFRNAVFKPNKMLQDALAETGVNVDIMIPDIEITQRELANAMKHYEERCEAQYGKSGIKHVTDIFSGGIRKVGEVLFAIGVKEALVFIGEYIWLVVLVENDKGLTPEVMVAQVTPEQLQTAAPGPLSALG